MIPNHLDRVQLPRSLRNTTEHCLVPKLVKGLPLLRGGTMMSDVPCLISCVAYGSRFKSWQGNEASRTGLLIENNKANIGRPGWQCSAVPVRLAYARRVMGEVPIKSLCLPSPDAVMQR